MIHLSLEYTEFPRLLFAPIHWFFLVVLSTVSQNCAVHFRYEVEECGRVRATAALQPMKEHRYPLKRSLGGRPSPPPQNQSRFWGGGAEKLFDLPGVETRIAQPLAYLLYRQCMPAALFVRTNIKLLQTPASIFRGMLVDWLAGGMSVIRHLLAGYCHCSKNVVYYYY